MRARYYNPGIGRFITEDSYLGEDSDPLSLNLYTYCYNNPVNFFDPSGHEPDKENAGTLDEFVDYVRKEIDTKIIFHEFESYLSILAGKYSSGDYYGPRYIYTRKAGWIDLNHFLSAATSSSTIISDTGVDLFGKLVEVTQAGNWLKKDVQKSGFSYEDLVSNHLGIKFGSGIYMSSGYNGAWNQIKSYFSNDVHYYPLSEQLELYFKALGADDPKNAPNYNELPNTYGESDGYPKNNSSVKPMYAPEYDKKYFEVTYFIRQLMGL